MPHFGAGSGLRSPLDKDDLTNAHKKTNVTNQSTFGLAVAVAKMERQIAQLRRRVLTPPATPQPAVAPFHPFKIYQPTNAASFSTGVTFLGSDGTATDCNIDPTVPTDFSATPPTVNPTTDGWRIWAVRSGLVEFRPIYNVPTPGGLPYHETDSGDPLVGCNNWAYRLYLTKNADGNIPFFQSSAPFSFISGFEEWDDSSEETFNPPIIFAGDRDPINQGFGLYGGIWFALWIEITPDTLPVNGQPAIINGLTARIAGKTWKAQTPDHPFPDDGGPLKIPIGIISPIFQGDPSTGSYTTNFVVDQQIFDHVINRYPPGNGTGFLGGGGFGSNVMNIRGAFYEDDEPDPSDLFDQVFYPGDIIVVNPGEVAGTNRMYQFIGRNGDGKPQKWTDPTSSNDWRQIFAGQTI